MVLHTQPADLYSLLREPENKTPMFIGPWQTPVNAPKNLKLAGYYLSSRKVVFDHKLTRTQLGHVPFEFLPLAVQSKNSVERKQLTQIQRAVEIMSLGKWESVYLPTRPGRGNNSGNGMTGIFFQRPDLEVNVQLNKSGNLVCHYYWPRIRKYNSRQGLQPQNFNYSLVYHHYRPAFEAAFDLLIGSTIKLHSKFLDVLLNKERVGIYFGITDYYGDPDILPDHLLKQALKANPNPDYINTQSYLDMLRRYREFPVLPGNYHTDGIEKVLDIQGIFTILNRGVCGGQTLIRRRGLRRNRQDQGLRPGEYDITACLEGVEGCASLWVPSWGKTEVEHTPGPLQGGHRTIIVFGLDSGELNMDAEDKGFRNHYGSQHETLSWDRRSWRQSEPPIMTPDVRLWNIYE